jgi:hypothetical protein
VGSAFPLFRILIFVGARKRYEPIGLISLAKSAGERVRRSTYDDIDLAGRL